MPHRDAAGCGSQRIVPLAARFAKAACSRPRWVFIHPRTGTLYLLLDEREQLLAGSVDRFRAIFALESCDRIERASRHPANNLIELPHNEAFSVPELFMFALFDCSLPLPIESSNAGRVVSCVQDRQTGRWILPAAAEPRHRK